MKQFIQAHWVWITSATLGTISFLKPSLQAFVSAHPQYSVAVATAISVAAAWANSPRQ